VGKIHDALKKAEREREALRRVHTEPVTPVPAAEYDRGAFDSTMEPTQRVPLPVQPIEIAPPQFAKTLTSGIPTTGAPAAKKSQPAPAPSGGTVQRSLSKSDRESVMRFDASLVAVTAPSDPRVEQFRQIRTGLQTFQPEPRCIVVTSSMEGEGKVVCASNMAAILAEGTHSRVLFVHADLRRDLTANLFGLPEGGPGFAEVLAGEVGPMDVVAETGVPHVCYVGPGRGTANPGALLSGAGVSVALRTWKSHFDRVIVCAPAVTVYADVFALAREADGALMVIRLGSTPRRTVSKSIDTLAAAGIRILGCVLMDAHLPSERRLVGSDVP
jgi:capsular exopolysaccharide synthesis family protein